MKEYTLNEINEVLFSNIDAILVIYSKEDIYKALKRSDEYSKFISEVGSYTELIETLCFHLSSGNSIISEEYQVFLPKMGEFKTKFAQKAVFEHDGVRYVAEMIIYPIDDHEGDYVIILSDMDKTEFERDISTENKVKTIQETYLFSMYVDLNKDVTSSINVSEISDSDMHYEVKYSDWRMMIVHTIWPEDQATFLSKTDPEYLRTHLQPSKTLSFDCQMKNLEGEYIWVKLIFGRSETTTANDFRFVFMVQNIHENSMHLFTELKKFETLASHDALTGVFNHGRIETELSNAIDDLKTKGKPVSLMMIDIDHFKSINDTYGHAVGDIVLKAFVNSINECLIDNDVKIGRWGGEEFVCICIDKTIEETKFIAEALRETIANRKFDKIGTMTCSIGVTNAVADENVIQAFERLDGALYQAKSSGRNCVQTIVK